MKASSSTTNGPYVEDCGATPVCTPGTSSQYGSVGSRGRQMPETVRSADRPLRRLVIGTRSPTATPSRVATDSARAACAGPPRGVLPGHALGVLGEVGTEPLEEEGALREGQ